MAIVALTCVLVYDAKDLRDQVPAIVPGVAANSVEVAIQKELGA